MLKWQFSPFCHLFKFPPLPFNPGQRSMFSDYVSVKCCQHLPESVEENKEAGQMVEDGALVRIICLHGAGIRERKESHNCQEVYRYLLWSLWQHSTAPEYISWVQFCSLLCSAAQLSIPAWLLPQSPRRAVPWTALGSNLTIIYLHNVFITPSLLPGKSALIS